MCRKAAYRPELDSIAAFTTRKFKRLPVGMILLIYDSQSFVSAKDWAEADRQKQEAIVR